MSASHIVRPANGEYIVNTDKGLQVPDNPIISFIEGDGIGPDIMKASMYMWDSAVKKAYNGKKQIVWQEVYAGEKANEVYNENIWLPQETIDEIRRCLIAIKGPLTTPVGGGFRSLNVALRQELDLYACVRPVRYFEGVPSPVKAPEKTDMIVFRENTEDIYAGIEWMSGTAEAAKVIEFLQKEMGVKKIRFPETSSIGIQPVSVDGSDERVVEVGRFFREQRGYMEMPIYIRK